MSRFPPDSHVITPLCLHTVAPFGVPRITIGNKTGDMVDAHVAFLIVLGAAFAVAVASAFRFLQNTLLIGKKPPVFEDIPFVGGLMKFIKVRARRDGGEKERTVKTDLARSFLQGPWGLMSEGYARFGEVFTVPVVHKRITFLIGPDVAPHFFKASDDEMSQTEVIFIPNDLLEVHGCDLMLSCMGVLE